MHPFALPKYPTDRRFRVLIVEDDPAISRLAATNLKMAGHAIFVARDGLEAWNQLPQINPHLILTDIHMPSLSGYELIERVRDVSLIPILLMTANDSEQAQTDGFKAGADDYISKPFTPQLLTTRVAKSLRRVYHYNGPAMQSKVLPKAKPAPTAVQAAPQGLPAGFVRCDTCNYIGPVWKFEKQDNTGNNVAQCPLCQNKNITFALS